MRRAIALATAAIALGIAACRDAQQVPVVSATVADSADQVFYGAETILTTKGVQRGILKADTAYILDDQTRIDLRKAHVIFTTESGAPEGTMDSDKGIYSTRTQILDGRGNAYVRLNDGRSLRSPHIAYNQLTHQLTSDTTYTMIRGKDTQTGIGFTSNVAGQSFSSFTCLKNCGGKMSVLLPER